VPQGHWKTTTFLAGLKQSGIVAPLALDGPMTGPAFGAHVEQFLAPALEPGEVVVLDNPAASKLDGVRQAIVAAGAAILYLPPYSPDLSPIGQLFATLKASCARPPHPPGTNSGRPSAAPSPPCRQANAPTTSTTAAMARPKMKVP
jgi:transposase